MNGFMDMHATLKIVAILINDKTCSEVKSTLSRVEGVEISVRMVGEERPFSLLKPDEVPDIILLEMNGHQEDDLEDIKAIMHKHGDRVTVFVITGNGDTETMRALMQAGVKDVFLCPLQTQELVIAVGNVLSGRRARLLGAKGARGGLTAFVNAKGGSGATTLAVNVAYALRKKFDSKVALIDLDIQFGVAATLLDLDPKTTVLDALAQPSRIDTTFLQALMTRHDSGLDVLASPCELGDIDEISDKAIIKLINVAVDTYDFVILDMPRCFTHWSVAALREAEPVILVVQNDLPSVRDARMVLEQLPLQGVLFEHIEVVNNRAHSKMHNVSIDDLKKILHRNRLHRVSNDYDVAVKAQDEGVPVIEVAKRSHMTKDIVHLAENLAKTHLVTEPEKKGFFKKLFGHRT